MNTRIRVWGANLLLATVAIIVTMAGFEMALRYFLPQKLYRYPRGLFRNDPDMVFSLTPGFRGEFRNPEYQTHVRINSMGLRGPELGTSRQDVKRVLGLGDSFVSAFNMEEDHTFLSVAGARLAGQNPPIRVEMINAGVPNYGTWHELQTFRRLSKALNAAGAVLFVFIGNDLENNLYPREAVVRDGFLLERRRQPGIIPNPIRSWLQRNSMAYVFLWNAWNQVRPWFGKTESDPLRWEKALTSSSAPAYVEDGYRVTRELLEEVRDEAAAHGIPLLVVLIPTEFQVYPSLFERMIRRRGEDPTRFDLTLPSKRWTEICEGVGLPVLDLLPVFRSHASGPYLYMSLDGHLTEEGNRLAGEATADALKPLLLKAAASGNPS